MGRLLSSRAVWYHSLLLFGVCLGYFFPSAFSHIASRPASAETPTPVIVHPASAPVADRLTIASPNGKYEVFIKAEDNGAGIWVTETATGRSAQVLNGFNQGPVLAVRDNSGGADDVAIALNKATGPGGLIQFSTGAKNDSYTFLEPKDVARLHANDPEPVPK